MEEPLTWETKNGEVLLVDEMSDSHVRNCFKLLLRRIRNKRREALIEEIEDIGSGPFFWKDEG